VPDSRPQGAEALLDAFADALRYSLHDRLPRFLDALAGILAARGCVLFEKPGATIRRVHLARGYGVADFTDATLNDYWGALRAGTAPPSHVVAIRRARRDAVSGSPLRAALALGTATDSAAHATELASRISTLILDLLTERR